jgi:hypothetical protein
MEALSGRASDQAHPQIWDELQHGRVATQWWLLADSRLLVLRAAPEVAQIG